MAGKEKSTIFTIPDLYAYRDRVAVAAARMKGSYRGAQVDCADDIGRQAITVSRLLSGQHIEEPLLTQVEEWIANVLGPAVQPATPVESTTDAPQNSQVS